MATAVDRQIARRVETIKHRCNFYEIYRNKTLFDRSTFNELISRSLAKTPDSDLPPEFHSYAKWLKNYEMQNPAKYHIANTFGRDLTATEMSDLMTNSEYNQAFGEHNWRPEELQKD